MSEFWTFAMASPFLTVFAALGLGSILGVMVIEAAYRVLWLLTRTVNIWKNGWPPPHCDSDGDLKR